MLIKGPSLKTSLAPRLGRLSGLAGSSDRKTRKFLVGTLVFGMALFQAAGLFAVARWARGGAVTREATRARHWIDSHLTPGSKPSVLDIDINFKNYQKLAFLREQAFDAGAIHTTEESWVPAAIRAGEQNIDVRMRLKGDVTNHLEGDKWSFRIKVKGDNALFGMKNFSIQDPKRSGHVHEWILHRLLRQERLIGLRYDFVEVRINGKTAGIHALEESFSKEMLEANHRREGPILKFDERYLWNRAAWRYESTPGQADVYYAAPIDSFQTSRITGSPELSAQFEQARLLLAGFRQGERSVSETFDIESTARLFAVLDLTTGWHAARWKNIRFYANPVTGLLEPIAYNAYDSGPHPMKMVYGAGSSAYQMYQLPEWMDAFFRDPKLHDRYVKHLDRMSKEGYLEAFFEKERGALDRAVDIIHRDNPGFVFKTDTYFENRDLIRRVLEPELPIQARLDHAAGVSRLAVANTGHMPIELLRFETGETVHDLAGMKLEGKKGPRPIFVTLGYGPQTTLGADNRLFYRVAGMNDSESELSVPVEPPPAAGLPWVQPDPVAALSLLKQHPGFVVDDDDKSVRILKGTWQVASTLVIPSGYTLSAEPATVVALRNGSSLLSFGSVRMEGTRDDPVVIEGDGTGGLVIVAAADGSTFRNVEFRRLGTPRELGLGVTGGVTLYESPLVVDSATFADSPVEDQLNIVRSWFDIKNTLFRGGRGDCLDIDFGEGTVESSQFEGCSNDAIDVSGTTVAIRDTRVNQAGDKAISAGEASRVTLASVTVTGSGLGVASKDLSIVTGQDVSIEGCRFGVGIYQKKPEFGPASIRLSESSIAGADTPMRVEKGSKITMNGLTHYGREMGLALELYDN